MERVVSEVLPFVAADVRSRAYSLLCLSPEQSEFSEKDVERLWQQAVIAAIVKGGASFFADCRHEATYNGTVWHTHHNAITTALATESGKLPTLFVKDQEEFMQRFSDAGLLTVLSHYPSEQPMNMCDPVALSNRLLSLWSSDMRARSEIRNGVDSMKRSMQGLSTVTPDQGTITFFGGDVIHASGVLNSESNPGSLYVSQWSNGMIPSAS